MAMGVERDARRQLVTEYAIQKAYELTGAGQTAAWPLEDDVAVSVGDSVSITNRTSPGMSALAAASMLIGGLGLGAAATQYLAGDAQQAVQPPAVTQPATDNRSLQTGLSVERGGALK